MLITSIFSFSKNVFKRLHYKGLSKEGFCLKGMINLGTAAKYIKVKFAGENASKSQQNFYSVFFVRHSRLTSGSDEL